MALKIITRLSNSNLFNDQAMAMKASIALSVVFHITLILSFQNATPLIWENEELRTYRVELIRPPVDDLETGEFPGDFMDDTMHKEEALPQDSQDTISLDTKDERYIAYTSLIKQEIMRHWKYPPEARAYLIEGNLMVLFSLMDDGRMTSITITRSSGHEMLDSEVVKAINSALPFPPFPESIGVKRLNINASFEYRLTSEKDNS
jgi:TonB family protein